MPQYVIMRGGVWKGGVLLREGATVELSEKEREVMDPGHSDLQSESEAEAEATKAAAEAAAAVARAAAMKHPKK